MLLPEINVGPCESCFFFRICLFANTVHQEKSEARQKVAELLDDLLSPKGESSR